MTTTNDPAAVFLSAIETLEEEQLLAKIAELYEALSGIGFEAFNVMMAGLITTLFDQAVDLDQAIAQQGQGEANETDFDIYTRALFVLADVSPGAVLASLAIVLANRPEFASKVQYMAQDCNCRITEHLEKIQDSDSGQVEVVDLVSSPRTILRQLQEMITGATAAAVVTSDVVNAIGSFVVENANLFRSEMQQTPRKQLMQEWRILLTAFSNLANRNANSMAIPEAKNAATTALVGTATIIGTTIPHVIATAIGESAQELGPQLVRNNSYVVTIMYEAAVQLLFQELDIVQEVEEEEKGGAANDSQADEESSE